MSVSASQSVVDMATALELPLGAENEAKFVALRNLQLKKTKQLLNAIDVKDKEIAKLKILNKDNRRTQMIQALRDKIRDLELINDVVKEELSRKTETSVEDVNELIMRKTLGGPKRFRPLTREEMENKIADLEKRISSAASKKVSPGPVSIAAESKTADRESSATGDSKGQGTSSVRSSVNSQRAANEETNSAPQKREGPPSLLNALLLVEEVQKLKATIGAKDSIINTQRDEIVRLRARNGELVKAEEELEFLERHCKEQDDLNKTLSEDLENMAAKLAEAMETANRYKSEASVTAEYEHNELLTLQQQCEKLLKQNSSLLKNLADSESALASFETETNKSKQRSATAESSVVSKDSRISALEDKLAKSEEANRQLDQRCAALQQEVLQIPALKEQLREKNISLKELKRNMEERDRHLTQRSGAKATPTPQLTSEGKPPVLSSPSNLAEEKEAKRTLSENSSLSKLTPNGV